MPQTPRTPKVHREPLGKMGVVLYGIVAFALALGAIGEAGPLAWLPMPKRPGTHDFYMAAAGIIPALLIPIAIEFRGFLGLLGRFIPLADALAVIIIFINLFQLAVGEASALSGLNCEAARCGTADEMRAVIFGLISAGALLLALIILSTLATIADLGESADDVRRG